VVFAGRGLVHPALPPAFASLAALALEFALRRGGVGTSTHARRKRAGAEANAARNVEAIKTVECGA